MYQEASHIDWSVTAAIISAATAIVAVIASPLFTYYLAKKQIASTVLSNERKEWVYALRLDVANFISNIVGVVATGKHFDRKRTEPNAIRYSELLGATSLTVSKIQMLLDPSDVTHEELSNTVEKIFNLLIDSTENATSEEFVEAMNTLIPL